MKGLRLTKKQKENIEKRFDPGKIYIGIVRDNRDPTRSGWIKVFIPGASIGDDHEDNWIVAKYASPFWGTTPDSVGQDFQNTKKSYGMWFVPPDIGNEVLVCFAHGQLYHAYWFASVPEFGMNHMVPGRASGESLDGEHVPVTELNRADENTNDTAQDAQRPENTPFRNALEKQGLITDYVRGQTSSSAKRESPSRVYGFVTPGGHTITLDDGWNDEDISRDSWNDSEIPKKAKDIQTRNPANHPNDIRFDCGMRIRTKQGAQILMSDTHGLTYIINRDGTAWIELDRNGNIDMWGNGSFSVHAEKDINLHAQRDVNIQADRNISQFAGEHSFRNSEGNSHEFVGQNKFTTVDVNYDIITSNRFNTTSGEQINLKSSSNMNLQSGGAGNIKSSDKLSLTGSTIGLNDPAPAADAANASKGETPKIHVLSKNLFVTNSVATRVPEQEPWGEHFINVPKVTPGELAFPARDFFDQGNDIEPGEAEPKIQEVDEPIEENICDIPQPIENLSVSDRGKMFIAQHEGYRPYTYTDAQAEAIGYGFNTLSGLINPRGPEWMFGMTENEAWAKLGQILDSNFGRRVKSVCSGSAVTQQQYDALVSLTYNCWSCITGDIAAAVKAGDIERAGQLIGRIRTNNRRMQETAVLFQTCNYGDLPTRCDILKEGVSISQSVYSNVTPSQRRQIQGALYRMGEDLPGGKTYLEEIRAKYGDPPAEYDSPCKIFTPTSAASDTDVQLSPNFWLSELTASNTATARGIKNHPTDQVVIDYLSDLANNILEPITTNYSQKPTITSGYRSAELNRVVGGAQQSQHSKGQAVDIKMPGVSTKDLATWINDNLSFDQLILERHNPNNPSSGWVHVSYTRVGNRMSTLVLPPSGNRYQRINLSV